jgi:preprotein translocase subunit SecD
MDNPIAEAYIKMLQERNKKEAKLDPVGQGDADIDNDGDVDSSDEYLHKRRKAIKKSMKKEEFTEEEQAMIDEAKKRGLTPDQVRKALATDKAKAKDKSKVSLRKTPWDKFKEAVEIETDDDKTDVEDPKAKKKAPEKKTGKGDPAAVNAPSQDDRAAVADKPDPSEDPDAEPTPPKEKEAPAPKEKEKIVVKKKPVDKEESVKKESFDWDEISEMNDEQVDAFIDSLDESQLDSFEAEMNSLAEAANPEGDAAQQDKEQGDFIAKHKKTIIDRPDADKPKAADATKPAAKRPGDKNDGDKSPVKRMKDIRK